MSRRIDFTATEEQLGELEQAIKTSPYPEVRQRAIAVRMLHLGQHPEQVAQAVMVTSNTVYAWHKRLLERDPRELGLPFTIWTINRLRLYLSETTGILLSYTRFRALLSREGYRWKEPKHDLSHLQDRPAQETAEQVMEWLKKTSRLTRFPNSSLWTKRP